MTTFIAKRVRENLPLRAAVAIMTRRRFRDQDLKA